MSLIADGNGTSGQDVRSERINAGTIGNDHVVPRSLDATLLRAIVDDQDPRVIVGNFDPDSDNTLHGQVTAVTSDSLMTSGTYTQVNRQGLGFRYDFQGDRIGVLASRVSYAGRVRFYIDGVPMPGRLDMTAELAVAPINLQTGTRQPSLAAGDTTLSISNGLQNIPSSGKIIIGDEIIGIPTLGGRGGSGQLGARTPGTITGITRGMDGTKAVDHYSDETVYAWDSELDLSSGAPSWHQLIYYRKLPFGQHHISVEVISAGQNFFPGDFYFILDGFLTGSLLGAKNISTQVESVSATVTTNAAGIATLGTLSQTRNNVTLLSMLGYVITDTTSALTGGTIQFNPLIDNPGIYLTNAPANTTVNIFLTFSYLGETV